MDPYSEHRYDRNASSLTDGDMKRLSEACVGVVGCGGLGGRVIDQLARVGVGALTMLDGDTFDASNLNRQLLCRESDIGRSKAVRAEEYVREVNSGIRAVGRNAFLSEDNSEDLLAGCTCVVDALDSPTARLALSRSCAKLAIPLVYGAIAGWYGQVALVMPGDDLYETLYCGKTSSDGKALGNLPCTCGVIASLQAAETIKLITGRASEMRNRPFMVDILSASFEQV